MSDMEKFNVFCLPFAGGNRYSFRPFEEQAGSLVNIIPLEYPGRGARAAEPLIRDITVLIDDICRQFLAYEATEKFAIWGHSMGALVALFLVRELERNGHQLPEQLFLSGCSHPCTIILESQKRYMMSRSDLIAELKELNGSAEDIFNDKDMFDYYEPIIRADFQVAETMSYEIKNPLPVPFTVLTGTAEKFTSEDARFWQKESTVAVDFRKMTGNHFFLFDHIQEILEMIRYKMRSSR